MQYNNHRNRINSLLNNLVLVLGEMNMNNIVQSGMGSSSARDRTNEFMTTIRSLQGQQLGRNGNYNQQAVPQDKHGQLGKLEFRCRNFNYGISTFYRTIQ